jgi:cytochrome P450
MTSLIHHSIDVFMIKIGEEKQPFDIYTYFKRFTMETIWSCGFGIETDIQNNIDDPYLVLSQQIFDDEKNSGKILAFFSIFIHELNHLWCTLEQCEMSTRYWLRYYFPFVRKFLAEDPNEWIMQQAYKIIDKRRKMGPVNRIDLMQLMLESASEEDIIQDYQKTSMKIDSTDNESQFIRKLTIPEIASNIYALGKKKRIFFSRILIFSISLNSDCRL